MKIQKVEKYETFAFSFDYIIEKMQKSECLLCKTNVRKEQKKDFHILLCIKHRKKYLGLSRYGHNVYLYILKGGKNEK
jgi:hypothetical protein